MHCIFKVLSAVLLATLCFTFKIPTSYAQDYPHSKPENTCQADDKSLISFSVGAFDLIKEDDEAVDFRLEYRPNRPILLKKLKPWAGLNVTSDKSMWVGGGLLYDWQISKNWYITPSFGAGYYAKGSSDLDLGFPLLFRSQIEASYQLPGQSRIGLAFSHLSNASLDSHNPGVETFSLYWHIPY